MKVSGFNEAVSAAVAIDPKYHPEGYQFLRESLEGTLKKRSKGRMTTASPHVSAAELLEGFRKLALKEYGPMAPTVFDHWGIGSCQDVGRMVFHLVEAGAFGRTEEDSMDAFLHGFDFHEAFVAPFLPPPSPEQNLSKQYQPSLFST
jgi:uncharacterized repeat protein (TIGR04138 family)